MVDDVMHLDNVDNKLHLSLAWRDVRTHILTPPLEHHGQRGLLRDPRHPGGRLLGQVRAMP